MFRLTTYYMTLQIISHDWYYSNILMSLFTGAPLFSLWTIHQTDNRYLIMRFLFINQNSPKINLQWVYKYHRRVPILTNFHSSFKISSFQCLLDLEFHIGKQLGTEIFPKYLLLSVFVHLLSRKMSKYIFILLVDKYRFRSITRARSWAISLRTQSEAKRFDAARKNQTAEVFYLTNPGANAISGATMIFEKRSS